MVVMTHTLFLWRQLHVVALHLAQVSVVISRYVYIHIFKMLRGKRKDPLLRVYFFFSPCAPIVYYVGRLIVIILGSYAFECAYKPTSYILASKDESCSLHCHAPPFFRLQYQ